jgi:hypothetical protein
VTVTRIHRLLPALLLAMAVSLPAAAWANGHGGFHGGGHGGFHGGFRGHAFFGFGCCGFWPGYYPAYSPYYYGYPAYPLDPYAYSAPAPGAVYQAPAYQAPAPAANCRRYNGDATIDASGQPFYGTACVGPDGRWHITGQ